MTLRHLIFCEKSHASQIEGTQHKFVGCILCRISCPNLQTIDHTNLPVSSMYDMFHLLKCATRVLLIQCRQASIDGCRLLCPSPCSGVLMLKPSGHVRLS